MKVGILALQGATTPHLRVLDALGVTGVEVRTPEELATVDRLVLPGGESTTMSMMLEANRLFEPIADRLERGMPVFGTCAGMILLGSRILDGRADQRCFGAIDVVVRRNAFGRQIDSFETELRISALGEPPFPAVFIRAPVVDAVGPDVEVLAHLDGDPVLCCSGSVLVAAFHPELSGDHRLHELFCELEPASSVR